MAPKTKEKSRRSRGEGGITQRKNGLYVAKLELPPDPLTGKRRQKTVTSMVHTEVVRKLNAEKRKLEQNGDLSTSSITLARWMNYWMDNINRSRPTTRQGYRSSIKYIEQSPIGRVKIDKLTATDVLDLERFITQTKKLSSTTALQCYRILSRALKDAERHGKVFRNVAALVDPPRKAAANLAELSADEGVRVLATVQYDRLGSRWAAALLTGARQGELLGLEIDRIDFEEDTIDFSWQLQRVNWLHGCENTGRKDDKGRAMWECGRIRGTDCPTRKIDAPADWEHRNIEGPLYWSRPKSSAGWRVIPLEEPLRSILERRIEQAADEPNPHGLVWTADPKKSKGGLHSERKTLPLDGKPIDPARDNAAWHAVLERAGVTQVRLHDARHAAVTILYDLGIDEMTIQDIVGQSVIAVTRKYRNKSKRSRKPAIEAMRALGGVLGERLALEAPKDAPQEDEAA